MTVVLAASLAVPLTACGSLEPLKKPEPERAPAPKLVEPVGIVVTERALRGGRLVLISQAGERLRELTRIGPVPVRDNGATMSPDGRFVAFASSRSRDSVDETSLWIVAVKPGSQPRRLTRYQRAVDRDPAWSADGRSLLFSSNRDGSFDLYRLPLTTLDDGLPRPAGKPIALTSGPDLDFHPSPRPPDSPKDSSAGQGAGTIAFMRVDARGEKSRIFVLEGDQVRALTDGPADVTPAWSPDGQRLAFAAPGPEREDADLYTVAADGSERTLVVAEPLADQTGPVWSPDGRYLFCTSVFRSKESGRPVFSSVTFADSLEASPVLRALHSRISTDSRMGPALSPRRLDDALIRSNLAYREALQRSVELDLIRASEARKGMN